MPTLVIVSIDPGPVQSAVIVWNGEIIQHYSMPANEELEPFFRHLARYPAGEIQCYIETMQSYGTTMGRSTIDTLIWIGRFIEQWGNAFPNEPMLVARPTIKAHLCQNPKANDSHVREALIDRIGPQGTKKAPGPTYGIKTHLWAALALAVYGYDMNTIERKATA